MTVRVLRAGQTGDDVYAWQNFLVGINPGSTVVANAVFDAATYAETQAFQRAMGMTGRNVDGIVGPMTLAQAMIHGFDPTHDDAPADDEDGPNWPQQLMGDHPLDLASRSQVFGTFAFKAMNNPAAPDAIVITDGWDSKNIISVEVPQLVKVLGAPKNLRVPFHVKVANQLSDVFADWEAQGLLDRIVTWGGSFVPRYVRGSRTSLSNHAWGTAFDINVQWNMLGTRPALKGQKGSVRELVSIARQHGFFWGGYFNGRPDGMHFEINRLLP